jgi:lipoprotein signal peptidase
MSGQHWHAIVAFGFMSNVIDQTIHTGHGGVKDFFWQKTKTKKQKTKNG